MTAIRGYRPDRVTAIVLALASVALAMRIVELGARAMHHDESLHAAFSWYYAEGRGYAHDPLMHGPLQFHAIAGAFQLLGASEAVARIPAALAGTALVASPLLLRRWLGGTGTVAVATLLALSPALLYFSRFARNDVPIALLTLLLVVAIWRYREGRDETADATAAHGGLRWLLLAAAALALSFTAKESAYLAAAALFVAIYLPLYSSLGSNPEGVYSGLWESLDYWVAQQDVQRGGQPGFYYLLLLPVYESLALVVGLAGGAWLLWRGDRLTRLLVWWFVAMLIGLSLAGEKMPWLTVHLALPLALLAGHAAGQALPPLVSVLARPGAPTRAWPAAGVGAALVLALGGLVLRTGTAVSYGHPDTPVEPLIYTQTSPDVPALAREIEAYAEASGQGRELPLVVETTSSLSWPWAWYLRDFSRVRYASGAELRAQAPERGSVLIATTATLAGSPELRAPYERAVPYRHRWWFPEGRYKSANAELVLQGIADGSLLADWWQFLADRVDESTLGSLDGEVLFPPAPAVLLPVGGR